MPHANPANLCQHVLPTGKLCRQITLKSEYFCRHHRRLFHKTENEMIHDEAMDRLNTELQSLDLPGLLQALSSKLARLRSTVRALPEAQLALNITLQRLKEQKTAQARPSSTPMNFPENPIESMSPQMQEFLKVLQNQ